MSTQKGNTSRSRPQKYRNKTAFKNNLHDTSHKTKAINSIEVTDVCQRCKEIIEWKIKYKVYKPLTQPKKCVKCGNKTVRKAYHIICTDCGYNLGICAKCGQSKDIVQAPPSEKEQLQLDEEMKELLKSLPERKRRTFLRYMNKTTKNAVNEKIQKEDIINKLNELKVNDDDVYDDFLANSDEEDDEED